MIALRVSLLTLLTSAPAIAHAALMPVASVPALDEWGLIGLVIGIGGLGAWLISRNR